jgi:hypothetical protein
MATRREFSKTLPKNNKSGYRGVWFDQSKGKWRAQIRFDKKCHKLGLYNTRIEAIKARQEAEIKYYGRVLEVDTNDVEINSINVINEINKNFTLGEMIDNSIGKIYGSWRVISRGNEPLSLKVQCIYCGAEYEMSSTLVFRYKTRICDCKKQKANTIVKRIYCKVPEATEENRLIPRKNIYSSKYIGVYWDIRIHKWVSQISRDGKTHRLGTYDKEIDAAEARLLAEKEIYGDVSNIKKIMLLQLDEGDKIKRKFKITVNNNFIEKELSYNELELIKQTMEELNLNIKFDKIE